jgi:MFS family permease
MVMSQEKLEHGMLKAGFSGAVAIGWLVFVILFLAFFSEGYRTNEKFALLLLSILIIVLLLGGLWLYWSMKMMSKKDWEMFKIKGFRWRIVSTIIYGLSVLIVLIYGFWYLWMDFGFWQYVALLLVVALVSGGILGGIWATWSSKYKNELETYGNEFGKKFEKGFEEGFQDKEK